MNTVPFNPRSTVDRALEEDFADLGGTHGTKGAPIEMNAILNQLDQGLRWLAAAIDGSGTIGNMQLHLVGFGHRSRCHALIGHLHDDPGHLHGRWVGHHVRFDHQDLGLASVL